MYRLLQINCGLSETHFHRLFLAAIWLLVIGIPVHAQETIITASNTAGTNQKSVDPIPLTRFNDREANINIDGHVDEPAWAGSRTYNELRVLSPDTLAAVPYKTDVRLFYTEKGLYVSFDMEQPKETVVKRLTARDVREVNRDYVTVTLDTSGEGRYGYWVSLALGDTKIDGTILPERQYSRNWDGAWYGATQTTDKGWSAEFFVPWSQMAMPKTEGIRRIGVYAARRVAHLNETWGWPTLPSSQAKFMSSLQALELDGVNPRQQWSLFPFASLTYDRIDDDVHYKAGLDVFWRPSSNFQLTATGNPDFGSVDSDDVIVNLTADETFFPEKRLFFQEGQEIFNTTPRSDSDSAQTLTIVNTRRIGGRPRPPDLPPGVSLPTRERIQPSELIGAAKVTGQIASFRYGVLGAWEDDTDFDVDNLGLMQEGRSFGAVRVLYEDNHGAAYRGLGFISTIVAHPEADAIVHGVDFHFLSSTGRWNVDSQILYSSLDEAGDGVGAFADITYIPRQGLKHSLALTAFDDKIDVNDFGFQLRNNIKEAWYRMEWIKSGLTRVRDFKISPFLRYEVNGAGFRTNNALASRFEFTLNNLDSVNIFVAHFPKRFDDRNSFGNGTFDVVARTFFNIEYTTDAAKPVSVFGKVGYKGEFVGGYLLEIKAGITWRPRNNINVELDVTYMDRNGWLLHQEDKNFTAFNATQWQPNFKFDYFPTARQQFRIALQWVGIRAREDEFFTLQENGTALIAGPKPLGPTDDFSLSQLNFQLRYRWQIAPLSDLFVVYTKADTRSTSLNAFRGLFQDSWNDPIGDQLVVKLRYRFGF